MSSRSKKRSGAAQNNANRSDDTSSDTSDSSYESTVSQGSSEDAPQDFEHTLDDALDLLTEKRYTVREAAWEKVNKMLRSNYLEDLISRRQETLVDVITRAVRKGTEKEAGIATTCTGILAITLGPSVQPFVNTLDPIFAEIILDKSKPSSTRVSALQAISTVVFVCSNEPSDTSTWIDRTADLFTDADRLVRVAALDAWCLLVSSLSHSQVAHKILPAKIKSIWGMLGDSDVDVKVAAGKALALLIEASKASSEALEEDFDIYSLSKNVDVADMIDLFHELSDGYTKQSKQEKQKQRNVFRDISRYVEDGEAPSELLSINHQKLTFEGWARLAQLNVFRNVLGSGLPIHLELNGVLADILSVRISASTPKKAMTALEKRLYQSPNSAQAKAQTRALAQGRAVRQNAISCAEY